MGSRERERERERARSELRGVLEVVLVGVDVDVLVGREPCAGLRDRERYPWVARVAGVRSASPTIPQTRTLTFHADAYSHAFAWRSVSCSLPFSSSCS